MNKRDYILLYINGKQFKVSGESVFQPLSDYLRYDLQKTGTKIVCAEGDCGSCTVALGTLREGKIDYNIVNSCIKYVYQLDCSQIITIEGLRKNSELTVIQESMVHNHGAQCGFCTPGFVVAMSALFENNPNPDRQQIKDGLTGNLCRCTGYESIIKSAMAVDSTKYKKFADLYATAEIAEVLSEHYTDEVLIETAEKKFYKPTTVENAVSFKKENPRTVLTAGGTDIGVQMNKKRTNPDVLLTTLFIEGSDELREKEGWIEAGANVTLSRLESFLAEKFPQFVEILQIFGSPQIRNAGTLAGNIANASPIADSLPFLFVTDTELELSGSSGRRRVKINDFYHGYKKLDLQPDEIISGIFIPIPEKGEILKLYKISKRKDLDISVFTAAFLLKKNDGVIETIKIAYGGVGPVVLRLKKTEEFLRGKTFSEQNFRDAGRLSHSEITPISDVRGNKGFRNLLAENALMKLFYECSEEEVALCR